ncbi:MAG: cell division protein FtsQ/DivIB [Oscillospiraceae bacterium]
MPTRTTSFGSDYIAKKARQNALRRRRKRQRVVMRFAILLVTLFALLFCIYFSLGVFFKVDNIIVKGEKPYSDATIIKVSGIKKGKNIFSYNFNNIAKKIDNKLLYAENTEIKRKLPGTILFLMHKAKPDFVLEFKGKYIILSEKGKILKKNTLTIPKDLDIILNVKVNDPVIGRTITGELAKSKLKIFTELRNSAKKAKIHNIKTYNLDDIQNIVLYCGPEGNIKVKFGNLEQLDDKMQFLAAMFNGSIDERVQSEIDLTELLISHWARWRPIEDKIKVIDKEDQSAKESKSSEQASEKDQ